MKGAAKTRKMIHTYYYLLPKKRALIAKIKRAPTHLITKKNLHSNEYNVSGDLYEFFNSSSFVD